MKTIFLMITLFFSMNAFANDDNMVEVRGWGKVPYEFLFEMKSESGESMDDFAWRVGERAMSWTRETGFEACGVIASDSSGFGVRIMTSYGHTACVQLKSNVPENMSALNETIHTHTTQNAYKVSATDMVVLGVGYRIGQVVKGGNPSRISDEDWSVPGYVVTGHGMKYHRGRGTERIVR